MSLLIKSSTTYFINVEIIKLEIIKIKNKVENYFVFLFFRDIKEIKFIIKQIAIIELIFNQNKNSST